MKKIVSLVILGSFLFLNGCSSIMTGTSDNLSISSNTPGAKVKIDGVGYGLAPVNIDVASNERHNVVIMAPGYKAKTMIVEKKVSGWVFGNIIFGGIPGLIVDMATGGAYVLETDKVNADLVKVDQLVKTDSTTEINETQQAAQLNAQDNDLLETAKDGDLDGIRLAIEAGADVNVQDGKGLSPLV